MVFHRASALLINNCAEMVLVKDRREFKGWMPKLIDAMRKMLVALLKNALSGCCPSLWVLRPCSSFLSLARKGVSGY
jgi:hypothetical protein